MTSAWRTRRRDPADHMLADHRPIHRPTKV
jgi:hypothetical protein